MYAKIAEKYAKFRRYVIWMYRLYELNTQIAICEPWEKVFCHLLIGSCLSLILYASYAYVPGYCQTLVGFLMPVIRNTNQTYNNIKYVEAEGMSSSSQSYLT
ncbi:serine palmitoyltransferase small subunit B [Drosophila novamexicana]|uniref:serine palmitoyltransferase small subunit B n=1 Tax=Drosophila novamexicana TaxID=47314 RepID=UPI0011E588C6|nr:serine palmitoyltransferase small subunit B [Drosophila novamexicana]